MTSGGPADGATPAGARRRWAPAALSRFQILLVVCLLLATAGAAFAALDAGRDEAKNREKEHVELVRSALAQQVTQAHDALQGVRGLFAADADVTQAAFVRFAGLALNRGGLQALFAAEPVRDADRAAFERRTGSEIKSIALLPSPSLTTSRRRPLYYPATLLAPDAELLGALVNLDLSVIPGVLDAFTSARDSGRIVAARPFALRDESPALFLIGAHYRPGAPLATAAQRRAALSGYAGAFFRAAGFAQAALEVLPPGARLQIFDGDRQVVGASGEIHGSEGTVDVGGRPWRIVLDAPGSPALALPATILGGGVLLSALVALFFTLGNRRERDLAEAEQRLIREAGVRSALLDAVPDGIMLVSPEGEVLVANPALERMARRVTGSDLARDARGRLAIGPEFVVDGERWLALQRALEDDPGVTREDEFELRTGQILRQFSAPVRMEADGPVTARIVVTRDVTVERRMDRMKDEFVATASHELRTPLTSIIGYLEALREGDAGDLAPEQERFLEVIARNGDRLRHLVDDLLDVARADAGLALAMSEVDLGEVLAEASQAARPAAVERGIELSVVAESGAVVTGDRRRLGQVVDNLVSNALKFTPPGGLVSVTVEADGDEVTCEVADTGVGIPAAEQERLFERFYRGSHASSDAVQGSGLGLAIVKMIVESHGGRIELSSEEGRGTRVRITLPAAVPAPAGSSAGS
ncbi:MAG: hypothetical protein QOD86_2593 [Miltoncostaeaceae bacterium]|nr:hypothetical protein [Miltoncostaeaceae bacterium]